MSVSALESIHEQGRVYCGGGDVTRGQVRTFREATVAPPAGGQVFVDPAGNDTADGTAARPYATLTRALQRIPDPGTSPLHTWEINLAANADFYAGTRAADDPRSSDRRGEAWAPSSPNVYFRQDGATLFLDQRAGTEAHPIIIKAAGPDSDYYDAEGNLILPDRRPRLHFRLNLRSVQHVYFKNLRVIISDHVIPGGAGTGLHDRLAPALDPVRDDDDVVVRDASGQVVYEVGNVIPVQLQTIPTMERPGALETSYVLLRGCEIDGGWRPGPAGTSLALVEEEVLKASQCRQIFIERCQIHGAYGSGKNAIDMVAVQYGHIVDSEIYDSQADWCVYVKGGSAHLRIEGNRIHSAGSVGAKGFSAGEGTDANFMVGPWWHYEAYAIQFLNNLVYDIQGTSIGVAGGFQVLIAHNTVYNAGWDAQMIDVGYGLRRCSAAAVCTNLVADVNGAWANTWPDEPGVPMIPNRHVYVYNNILFNPTVTSNFNVITIHPDLPNYVDPPDPMIDYSMEGGSTVAFPSDGRLPAMLPRSPANGGITADGYRRVGGVEELAWDRSLRIVGNFVRVGSAGILRRDDAGLLRLYEGFFNPNAPVRSPSYEQRFMALNRVDDATPELVTERTSRNFLRPSGSGSNVVAAPVAVSKVDTPPPVLTGPEWDADLPRLPATTMDVPWRLPRDPSWAAAHTLTADYDRACRSNDRIVPGARTRWNEFYVRDWFETATRCDFGEEPSTRAVFWTTSDVWNRTESTDGIAPSGVPMNQSPRAAPGSDNWAYARIRRNAPGTAQRVSARFLAARFGMGSAFEYLALEPAMPGLDAGLVTVDFAPDQTERVVSYRWRLPAGWSGHVCLAVEIESTADGSATPTLRGRAPGAGGADPDIVRDNNKAQRNLDLGDMPMAGAGGASMAGAAMSLLAEVRNPALIARDVEVRYEVPPQLLKGLKTVRVEAVDSRAAPPRPRGLAALIRRLLSLLAELLGLSRRRPRPSAPAGSLTFKQMQPGESRWVCITFGAPTTKGGDLPPIHFHELVGGRAVNGFSVAVHPVPVHQAAAANLDRHAGVLSRAGVLLAGQDAAKPGKQAPPPSLGEQVSDEAYLRFVRAATAELAATASGLAAVDGRGDGFGVNGALERLRTAARNGDAARTAAAHADLLNRLDAALTAVSMERGDPTAALHNVEWQQELFRTRPQLRELPGAAAVREQSADFVSAYGKGPGGDGLAPLLGALLPTFGQTAKVLGGAGVDLESDVAEMERSLKSPPALQRAHRRFLLKLDALAMGK